MLNLLKKTKPWMVASLIVATSVFGQNGSCNKPCPPKPCPKPCPQPCPPTQMCPQDPCCPAWPTPVLNAAYNYPARMQTRCAWDFFFDASFIYWQPSQDNMELGFSDTSTLVDNALASVNSSVINMDFGFKPGFRVGIGGNYDHDNWDTRLEYTWFHNTNSQSSNGPTNGRILPLWGTPFLTSTEMFNSAKESWNLKMDIIELDLGRWEYVGTKLVFRPSFGLRADWIRQDVTVTYTRNANSALTGNAVADISTVTGKIRSWGLGPQVGLNTNWDIGAGFRLYGNGEADLLFTKYTKSTYHETHTATPTISFRSTQGKIYTVRPHMDLELGFGWGTYLDCNNWYMDFTAGYDFQVFFDQNMFRHFNDDQMVANSTVANGNLYTQGLTVKFRLDF